MGEIIRDVQMSRLEDLQLQRELKELVLEYVTTTFTPSNLNTHGFALLICRHSHSPPITSSRDRDRARNRTRSEEIIMIRAIAYLTPDKTTWKVLARSSKAHYGITAALQEFSKDLEREMGRMADAEVVHVSGRKRKTRSGLFGEEDEGNDRD